MVPGQLQKDNLPKDISSGGKFADEHFVERTFCRTDSLTNGLLTERIFWTTKGQLAENRGVLGADFSTIM